LALLCLINTFAPVGSSQIALFVFYTFKINAMSPGGMVPGGNVTSAITPCWYFITGQSKQNPFYEYIGFTFDPKTGRVTVDFDRVLSK